MCSILESVEENLRHGRQLRHVSLYEQENVLTMKIAYADGDPESHDCTGIPPSELLDQWDAIVALQNGEHHLQAEVVSV